MNIIVLIQKDESIETYGSLKEICRLKGFNYNTLSRKKYPFTHEGIRFNKVKHRNK